MSEIVIGVLGLISGLITAYFAFRSKAVGYNKEECEKLKLRMEAIEKENSRLTTNEKVYKAGLKMLLKMKESESNENPDDARMIRQMIENLQD